MVVKFYDRQNRFLGGILLPSATLKYFARRYNYFWSTARFSFRLIQKLQIVDIVTHFDKYGSLDKNICIHIRGNSQIFSSLLVMAKVYLHLQIC